MSRIIGTIFVFVFFASSPGWALHLNEHRQITEEAIRQFNLCFPENVISISQQDKLISGNWWEDLNLYRKLFVSSHFYRPIGKLSSKRKRPNERITVLLQELRELPSGAWEDQYDRIGAITHSIQDAATPTHVVPVDHDDHDSYELFKLSDEKFPRQDPKPEDCQKLLNEDLPDSVSILRETALTTLANARGPFEYFRNQVRYVGSWTLFWRESEGDGLGHYGPLGDYYGVTRIEKKNVRYEFPAEQYDDFRIRQMNLAIHQTVRVLLLVRHLD